MSPEILLIDDDVRGSVLRKRVLEHQGYRVQLALDGANGVVLAAALHPALVLLDHSLPDLDGPDVLRRLRTYLPNTPVISHSGHDSLNSSYDLQPDAFLVKGDGVQQLLRTISELIS